MNIVGSSYQKKQFKIKLKKFLNKNLKIFMEQFNNIKICRLNNLVDL